MMTRRSLTATMAATAVIGVSGGASAAQTAQAPLSLASGDPWPPRETIPLWPKGLPGGDTNSPTFNPSINGAPDDRQLWLRGVSDPAIHVYRPETSNGVGVLSIPGGGYDFVSFENEGANIAHALTLHGYTVFVLSYRLPAEGWAAGADVVLQDAQRAMRMIRYGAETFGVRPDQLAALGFSAGGHLAGMLAVAHDRPVYEPTETADAVSARPDALGLAYPLVGFDPKFTSSGSSGKLLGADPTPEELAAWSPVGLIDEGVPPSFLVHSLDDGLVGSQNPIAWAEAVRDAGQKVELHLFDSGGHGYGPATRADHPAASWPGLFGAWLTRRFEV